MTQTEIDRTLVYRLEGRTLLVCLISIAALTAPWVVGILTIADWLT